MATRCSTLGTLKRPLLLLLVAAATLIAYQSPDAHAYRVMVANNGDDSISLIDSARPDEEPVLVENVGDGPTDFVYGRFSRYALTAFFTLESDSRVRNLDLGRDIGLGDIDLGTGKRPGPIEIDWDQLYVVNRGPAPGEPANGSLSIIDVSGQNETIETVVGSDPSGLAVSKRHNRIFVTNGGSNNVSVIDIEEFSPSYGTVVDTINLPLSTDSPTDIAKAYVGDEEYMYVTNWSSYSVTVINAETLEIIDRIGLPMVPTVVEPGQEHPSCPRWSGNEEDGWSCFSTPKAITAVQDNAAGNAQILVASRNSNSVSVIDARQGAIVGAPIEVGGDPSDIEVADDGLAYISNEGSNTVSTVDTEVGRQIRETDVGGNPTGLGIYPFSFDRPDPPPCDDGQQSLVNDEVGRYCIPVDTPQDPPPPVPPEKPKQKVQSATQPPERCERVLYENELEVPREVRLADLVNGKGIKVKASASKPSSGTVKVEITGRNARHFKLYKKTSSQKNKLLASAKVQVGSTPKEISLSANSKARKLIKRALRLKRAPKRTKLKVSLVSTADSSKSLKRLNAQTVRALRKGSLRRTDSYKKVRQVIDYSLCGTPLKAKIEGPSETKLSSLATKRAKRGRGIKVQVSCSEDCTALVGLRMWGRYEIGLKFRKTGQTKNRWLSSRTVKLRGGEAKTLTLKGVSSKKLRKLLVRGASNKRYDRVKVKYLIEARTEDGKSGADEKTARVKLRF